jgi:Meckelin (Transmembrane protein 67)
VSYGLRGNLIEMRPMKLGDINLCSRFAAPANLWQSNVKFAKNFFSKCTINLQEFVALQPDTKFSSLHLNYFEGQANFLQTVPILIRNAFEVNEVRTKFESR